MRINYLLLFAKRDLTIKKYLVNSFPLCLSLYRNSTSSAMKWLWKHSAPSDWLWAEILFFFSWFTIDAAYHFQRNTGTHEVQHRFLLTQTQPVSMCASVPECVCVCLKVRACDCLWIRESMLVHLCVCVYL